MYPMMGYVPGSALFEAILIGVNFTRLTLRRNVFREGFVIFHQSWLSLQFPFQPVFALHSLRNIVL